MADTLGELRAMPTQVRRGIGYALDWAQRGGMSPHAKLLKGPGLQGVVEVVEDHRGNTYRAAYIAKLEHAVYVLHVFQKKPVRAVATPRRHLELIRQRLRAAKRLDSGDRHETHE